MTRCLQQMMLSRRVVAATAALLLAACSSLPPEAPVPVADPEPAVVQEAPPPPPAVIEPVPSDEHVAVEPVIADKPPLVAVLISDRHPAYENVAAELDNYLENYTVFDLSDRSQPPVTAFRLIEDANTSAVVAIGLRAAISAIALSKVPVVFCQVFNVRDHDLITDKSRGVSTLPPLDLQIAAWKEIDPTLESIGAIIGDGHEELIAEAELAAAAHGIDLHIRTASSDRETLYLFNRLAADIDGFWLFPDNRVLSAPVLRKMMRQAERRRVRVAVFNESLLALGADISSSPVESDIAETIVDVLSQMSSGDIDDIPPLSALSDVRVLTREHLSVNNEQANLAGGQ